jgi:autotransporter translocation and assembly factor TamB
MLQAAVLALCVFSHNEDIYVLVPGHHTWKALTVNDIGIEVQAGAKDVVSRFVRWWKIMVCFDVAYRTKTR